MTALELFFVLLALCAGSLVIAYGIALRSSDETERSAPAERPLTAALAFTGVATLAFGVAAEPLLRVAERATMLGG